MAIGVMPSVGKTMDTVDYNITITAKTGNTDNWEADATVGTDCYTQTVLTADISPNLYIDGGTKFYVLPHPNSVTSSALEQFAWLACAESTDTGIKFYSVRGKPSFDIPVTIRIII